ncbi:hypothetical protein niasHS_009636 [Heterodera schachtii]|uniref:DNA-directed RNA polymerases I, II, and III subunit RPABC5 n=1 Tax=Heterodera schachtii TaxID=97005 RepID=A0ABD2JEG1_HETSC
METKRNNYNNNAHFGTLRTTANSAWLGHAVGMPNFSFVVFIFNRFVLMTNHQQSAVTPPTTTTTAAESGGERDGRTETTSGRNGTAQTKRTRQTAPVFDKQLFTLFEMKERGVDMHESIKRRKDNINPTLSRRCATRTASTRRAPASTCRVRPNQLVPTFWALRRRRVGSVGLRCFCCRRMLLSHVDLIEKLLNNGSKARDDFFTFAACGFICRLTLAHFGTTLLRALDQLGLRHYCCRRLLLSHVDLIEKLLNYDHERASAKLPERTGLSDAEPGNAEVPHIPLPLCEEPGNAEVPHIPVPLCEEPGNAEVPHIPVPLCEEPGNAEVPHIPLPLCEEPGNAEVPHIPLPLCEEPGNAEVPHIPLPCARNPEPGNAEVPHIPLPLCEEPGNAEVPHIPLPLCEEPGNAEVPHNPLPLCEKPDKAEVPHNPLPMCEEPGNAEVPHNPLPTCEEPGNAEVPHNPLPMCEEPGNAEVPHMLNQYLLALRIS